MDRRDFLRLLAVSGATAIAGVRFADLARASAPGDLHLESAYRTATGIVGLWSSNEESVLNEYEVVDDALILTGTRTLIAAQGLRVIGVDDPTSPTYVVGTLVEAELLPPDLNTDTFTAEELLLLPPEETAAAAVPRVKQRSVAVMAPIIAGVTGEIVPLVPDEPNSSVAAANLSEDGETLIVAVATGGEGGPLGGLVLVEVQTGSSVLVDTVSEVVGEFGTAALGSARDLAVSSHRGDTVLRCRYGTVSVPFLGYVIEVGNNRDVPTVDMHVIEDDSLHRLTYLGGQWFDRELYSVTDVRSLQRTTDTSVAILGDVTPYLIQEAGA